MLDVERLIGGVHDYIERAFSPLLERIKALEGRQLERGEKGDPGVSGKDGESIRGEKGDPGLTGRDGSDGVRGEKGDLGAKGDAGKDGTKGDQGDRGEAGKDGTSGRDGDPGKPGENGKDGTPGDAGLNGDTGDRGEKGEPGLDGKNGADGIQGKDGRDGIDGKDGSQGIQGKDGERGLDGRSVTIEEVRPIFEGEIAKWQLDFELRGMEVLQRAIDKIQTPKDGLNGKDGANGRDGIDGKSGENGINGKDGADGLDLDAFDLELDEDGRTLRFTLISGEKRYEKAIKVPWQVYRDVFVPGHPYGKGDNFTYGGSVWMTLKDSTGAERPGDASGVYRLAVKRGADAK